MITEPEHFARIVDRLFVRLREMELTMPQPSPISINTRELTDDDLGPVLMSGEEHYARAERLLAQADAAAGDYARVHELTARARTHYAAAQAAAAIWPADLVKLRAVLASARRYVAGGRDVEYGALVEAVEACDPASARHAVDPGA